MTGLLNSFSALWCASGDDIAVGKRAVARDITAFVIGTLTLALFLPTLTYQFVTFDDPEYVFENRMVVRGIAPDTLKWAFTAAHLSWYPLTWLSYLADSTIFGMRPSFFHLTNVLLHVATTVLFFYFLSDAIKHLFASAIAVAWFSWHPLRVESVAWVSERKGLLAGVALMLLLMTYRRYVKQPSLTRYLVVLFCIGFGLMSKPTFVVAPALLVLLDIWPLQRLRFQPKASNQATPFVITYHAPLWLLVLEKAPFCLLSLLLSTVTLNTQAHSGAMANSVSALPYIDRIGNAVVSVFLYLWKMLWPQNLSFFYPHPGSLPMSEYIPYCVALACFVAFAIASRQRYPYIFLGCIWFLISLVPVLGLVQVGMHQLADRYTYIPSIGIATSIGAALAGVLRQRYARLNILLLVALAILASQTASQRGIWKDSLSLYTAALQVNNGNWLAHRNLASLLASQGRYMEAEPHFFRAITLFPDNGGFYRDLGSLYFLKGNYEAGIQTMAKAAELAKSPIEKAVLRGSVALAGRDASAGVVILERVLQSDPSNVDALYELTLHYSSAETPQQHQRALSLALRLCAATSFEDPYYLRNLAKAYAVNFQYAAALQALTRAGEQARSSGLRALANEIEDFTAQLMTKAGQSRLPQ